MYIGFRHLSLYCTSTLFFCIVFLLHMQRSCAIINDNIPQNSTIHQRDRRSSQIFTRGTISFHLPGLALRAIYTTPLQK